jgi:hypothetical protein
MAKPLLGIPLNWRLIVGLSVIGSSFEKGLYSASSTQSCWVGTTFSLIDLARKGWVYGTLISNS